MLSSQPKTTQTGHSAKLVFDDVDTFGSLCGPCNATLNRIEKDSNVSLHVRGLEVTVEGDVDTVAIASRAIEQVYALVRRGVVLTDDDISRAIVALKSDINTDLGAVFSDVVMSPQNGVPITAKGIAQKNYVNAVKNSDIVFAIGPAGTGKTYLAVAMAAKAFMDHQVKRIILTRPAVEAGERLGFLPGTMEDKVNPYLKPLYDALHDMMDDERVHRLVEKSIIEVAPLAFMRGRTLNDAFVIFDEAQNATSEQMKMFLTRLGKNSKAVVNGDVTQTDLPTGVRSGLCEAQDILKHVKGISICLLDSIDVVRHPLVRDIVDAYKKSGH